MLIPNTGLTNAYKSLPSHWKRATLHTKITCVAYKLQKIIHQIQKIWVSTAMATIQLADLKRFFPELEAQTGI